MNQSEAAEALAAANERITKIETEVRGELDKLNKKVADLQAALENAGSAELSPQLRNAIEQVVAGIARVDDLVPDAPTPAEGGAATE